MDVAPVILAAGRNCEHLPTESEYQDVVLVSSVELYGTLYNIATLEEGAGVQLRAIVSAASNGSRSNDWTECTLIDRHRSVRHGKDIPAIIIT